VSARRRRGALHTRAPLIGLTGPIGCGKSTVAGWLSERGAAIIDADELTRTVMAPGSAVARDVVARFGEEYLRPDGSLDRPALGRLVFSDPSYLASLEAIVHPAIQEALRGAVQAADESNPAAIVLEAIKLVEGGEAAWCDEVWLIVCDPDRQLARLLGRGMPEVDARQRIHAQLDSMPVWRSVATRIIDTTGDPGAVRILVDAALDSTLAR
jgi:dephospho-CoA kinase